jgi:hypothetical protein
MKPGSVPAKPGILGAPMLTDVQIRKAKAADKPYKLTDGGGLHVYVTSAGGKLWRLIPAPEQQESAYLLPENAVDGSCFWDLRCDSL